MCSLHVARKLRPGKPVSDERGAGSYGIYMYTTSCACACMHERVPVSVCTYVSVCVFGICVYHTSRCTRSVKQGSLDAGCVAKIVRLFS